MQDRHTHFSFGERLKYLPVLLNSVDNPVLVINQEGKVIFANPAAFRLTGWQLNGQLHDDIDNISGLPSLKTIAEELNQRLQEGKPSLETIIIPGNNGDEINYIVQVSSIESDRDQYICLVFDIPESEISQKLNEANEILIEVDNLLGDVVDYDAMLKKLVEYVIPNLADMSVIHVIQPDGSLEAVAFAPASMNQNRAILDWLEDDLPNDEIDGLPAVIDNNESVLIPYVSQASRTGKAGIKSYMILPLITHRQIRGTMTFIGLHPERLYNDTTLQIARTLAINVSIYLEKNRLYKESQKLKAELEQHVADRTVELREAISQLKQSEQINQTLFRISNKLNGTLEVDLILDELAKEAIHIVNGESGFAGLHTPEGMNVKKYFHKGIAIPFVHTWGFGDGIPGWVLKYKVPYGTSDAINDPLIRSDLAINENVRSIICTPVLDSQGEVIGYFDIRNKIGAEGFSVFDQEMLLMIAPVASIAIQNALAYQRRLETVAELKESSRQLEELAARLESTREEERLRISRELHDQLGQSLTAIKFDLTALTEQLNHIDTELAHKGKDIMTQVNTMIKTVRRITTELRPGMLDDLGLIASIEWQASDFQKRTGIECKVYGSENDLSLSKEQSLVIFRIFQEALTNVARYANAKHVEIRLTTDGEVLNFDFHDDGRGIRPEEISGSQSLGLLGMRERVKHIGGIFRISGTINEGTTINVIIPLSQGK